MGQESSSFCSSICWWCFFELTNFTKLALGFVIFSLIASLGYVVNDWIDKGSDSLNDSKSHRPFAKGDLSSGDFVLVSFFLLSLSLSLLNLMSAGFVLCIALYFINTLFYSLGLKHVPVIEMVILAFGFLLRPLAGAAILGLPVSENFMIVVIFGSLSMVAAKRLSELKKYPRQYARRVVLQYSESFWSR
jgi:decaprenyl-phosphate phosphoribosyltransferase